VLVLDAGDALNGEVGLGLLTKGEMQVAAMNLMEYDAMTIGSGDLTIGWAELGKRMSEAHFPLLSANLVDAETGKLVGQPYVIEDLTPEHRAAIIGLTDPYAADLLAAIHERPAQVLDPLETARRYVDELAGQADIIIVLSHLGYDDDVKLATAIPEIDLIVGGKSGHIFDPPTRPSLERTGHRPGRAVGPAAGGSAPRSGCRGQRAASDRTPGHAGCRGADRPADDRPGYHLRNDLGCDADAVLLRRMHRILAAGAMRWVRTGAPVAVTARICGRGYGRLDCRQAA